MCVLHASKCSKVNTHPRCDTCAQMETVNMLWKQTSRVGILSLRRLQCPVLQVFFAHTVHLVCSWLCFLQSMCLTALSLVVSTSHFSLSKRSANEGGPENPSAVEAADEGWWMAADDIKVVHVCLSIKQLSEKWGVAFHFCQRKGCQVLLGLISVL